MSGPCGMSGMIVVRTSSETHGNLEDLAIRSEGVGHSQWYKLIPMRQMI